MDKTNSGQNNPVLSTPKQNIEMIMVKFSFTIKNSDGFLLLLRLKCMYGEVHCTFKYSFHNLTHVPQKNLQMELAPR